MNIPLSAAAAALLVSLVSCESTAPVAGRPAASVSRGGAAYAPFAGGAPPSVSWTPPERYYAFGGGYSSARRQTEGDDNNFLRYNDHCYHRCGYYRPYGGYGSSCWYRPRCW